MDLAMCHIFDRRNLSSRDADEVMTTADARFGLTSFFALAFPTSTEAIQYSISTIGKLPSLSHFNEGRAFV